MSAKYPNRQVKVILQIHKLILSTNNYRINGIIIASHVLRTRAFSFRSSLSNRTSPALIIYDDNNVEEIGNNYRMGLTSSRSIV